MTGKVIKVTYDTHLSIKLEISPYFFIVLHLMLFHTRRNKCQNGTKSAAP